MNGKTGLALVSLPAALPAGALAVLLILAFLSYGDNIIERMPTLGLILAGGMLLLSTLVFLMPAAILIFGPKQEEAEETAEDDSEAQDEESEPAAEADEEAVATQPKDSGSTEEAELLDSDEAAETVTAESDDELVAESDDFLDEWDADEESEKK